jgi:hypothetical protein
LQKYLEVQRIEEGGWGGEFQNIISTSQQRITFKNKINHGTEV